jgi:hypothetical protein
MRIDCECGDRECDLVLDLEAKRYAELALHSCLVVHPRCAAPLGEHRSVLVSYEDAILVEDERLVEVLTNLDKQFEKVYNILGL